MEKWNQNGLDQFWPENLDTAKECAAILIAKNEKTNRRPT